MMQYEHGVNMLPKRTCDNTHFHNDNRLLQDFNKGYLKDRQYDKQYGFLPNTELLFSDMRTHRIHKINDIEIEVKATLPNSQITQLKFLIDVVGLNISQLSALLKVGRPSIYAWLEGAKIRQANLSRFDLLYDIFKTWNAKFKLGAYLYKKIDGQLSLYDLLCSDSIKPESVKKHVKKINKILLGAYNRAEQRREKLKAAGFVKNSKEQRDKILNSLIRKA